jgi:hypothetical protein
MLFLSRGVDLELLLNLCWLLLIGPGVYLWLRQRRHSQPLFQFSIALACLLFLLFPVISASDDLHAMRQEMEESSPTKRALKQIAKRAPGQESSAPPAHLTATVEVLPCNHVCEDVPQVRSGATNSAYTTLPVSRPPPSFFPA